MYSATLVEARDEGGMVAVTAKCGERLVAEGEIVFAHVDPAQAGSMPNQKNVVEFALQSILEVGKAGDGSTPAAVN